MPDPRTKGVPKKPLSAALITLLLPFRRLSQFGTAFWGPEGLVWGLEKGATNVFGSTHVVEHLSFSMFLLIPTFDF